VWRKRGLTGARNGVAAALSVVAGILFLVSGTHGPVGSYEFILENLPSLINDEFVLSAVRTAALVLISISLLGGFVLLFGGYLICKGHGRTGKLAIGLGTGAGIPWLVLTLVTLVTTGSASSVLAQYSTLGWIGFLMALAARFVAK
jgi:hypothetical protein